MDSFVSRHPRRRVRKERYTDLRDGQDQREGRGEKKSIYYIGESESRVEEVRRCWCCVGEGEDTECGVFWYIQQREARGGEGEQCGVTSSGMYSRLDLCTVV